MCFSAEASFTAAVLLSVIGYFTTKAVKDKRLIFLSWIPYLFAAQQLSEGFLWVFLKNPEYARFIPVTSYFFLIFALLVWPVYIPLSLFIAETVRWRRIAIGATLGIGLLYADILLYSLATTWPSPGISVEIIGNSIHYKMPQSPLLPFLGEHGNIYFYCASTLIPVFLSSVRYMWILAITFVVGYIVASYLYNETFVSVWCFFAACMSASLYYILTKQPVAIAQKDNSFKR